MPRRKRSEEEQAAWRARERLRAKKYREANADKTRAATVAWRKRFPIRNRASNAAWRAKPGSLEKTRDAYLKRNYGITLKQEQNMLQAQHGCCAICEIQDPGKSGWHVDHNHATTAVRSLLCNSCNKALAFAKDNPVLLRKMACYLERYGHSGNT